MANEIAIASAAASVVNDKRGRTLIATIICTVITLLMLPIITFMGVIDNMAEADFSSSITPASVISVLSSDEINELKHLEKVMNAITKEFKDRDMTRKTKRAQAVYCCALYDIEPHDNKFVEHLADCFENASNTEELCNELNATFGVNISLEELKNLLNVVNNTIIDLDIPDEKTNEGLVEWAKYAYDNHWGYVWGSHGQVLTEKTLTSLKNTFGSHVTDKEDYIRQNWMGKRTADCVGLIKGYGWYDNESGTIKYGTNEMRDVTADGMYSAATEKGPINTIPEIPGLAVWHEGHIGIYIGNGYVIHAANTYAGVIKTPITSSGWTHWLKVPYINYMTETENTE